MAHEMSPIYANEIVRKRLKGREKSVFSIPLEDYQADESFTLPEKYKVAKYDDTKINRIHSNFHQRPIKNLLNIRYIRYNVIGHTCIPVVVFLATFILVLIIYYLAMPSMADCKRQPAPTLCSHFSQTGFKQLVADWKIYHDGLGKMLTFLLGFYVSTTMKRWWSQLSKLPHLEDLAMVLNGMVEQGEVGSESGLAFKKKILKHCLLSVTLCFLTVSKSLKILYGTEQAIVDKGLGTSAGAIARLKKDKGPGLAWMDKWWLPINWCCHLVRQETGTGKLIVKDSKEVINSLVKFKHSLESVAEYTHSPLPAIMSQAVFLVSWIYLIFGALALQPCNADSGTTSWWIIQDMPLYHCFVLVLIFAWLKMAEICKSPFDGDKHYDIKLEDELDMNIWAASAALEPISHIPAFVPEQ